MLSFSFQCLNANLDTSFQDEEIQDIADRIILSTVDVRFRTDIYQQNNVVEETSRLTSMLVSFKRLVDYIQTNKPSCITTDIREVYDATSTDAISSLMRECLPCNKSNVSESMIHLVSDVFDRLKTVDMRLLNISDEIEKDIEYVLANWCVPGSFYEFCIEAGQDILLDLNWGLLCLTRNVGSVTYKVEASIQSLGECSKIIA